MPDQTYLSGAITHGFATAVTSAPAAAAVLADTGALAAGLYAARITALLVAS